jgi:Rha family phage regulatory protein
MSNDLILPAPLVHVREGKVYASSRDVADFFGKRHDNVIRDIRELMASQPDFSDLNFRHHRYVDKGGRNLPCFDMTRDGFTLLAMGFTGDKALQFKIKYIDAFSRMEAALKTQSVSELSAFGGVSHIPALQVAKNYDIPQKGRRPVVVMIGNRLAAYCDKHQFRWLGGANGSARLFPVDAVTDWLNSGGDGFIWDLLEGRLEKTALTFKKLTQAPEAQIQQEITE